MPVFIAQRCSSMSRRRPQKPRKEPPAGLQFRHVSVGEAAREKGALTSHRKASEIYVDKLWLTADQRRSVAELQETDQIESWDYRPDADEDQVAAAARLAGEGLELGTTAKSLGNRWSVRWSRNSGKGFQETCRQLYQWYVSITASGSHKIISIHLKRLRVR